MRRHKYGAVATTVDGVRFASKAEARRYVELKMLQKAGHISDLELQPEFELTVERNDWRDAFAIPLGKYRADFTYIDRKDSDKVVVEDVKGFKTPLYRWKKKHVEAQYGIEIREV